MGYEDALDFISGRLIGPDGYMGTTPTELIGRAHDLERLDAVLAAPDARLVTVTGPAGVGKSRLVMEFFRRYGSVAEVFDFERMADVAACRRLLRQAGEQVGEGSPAVRAAIERLGADREIVVLDHVEDVAAELVPLLAEFRRCCPHVRIVSVGTTRLGMYGERVLRLRPLATGDAADVARIPSVELFVRCARSVRPEFTLTAENSSAVLALCHLAGGLPLAIELAASQVELAEPALILERFKGEFGDLRGVGHHPYSRHSSIGDLVSWVFARLRADERTLLDQLAIFAGPFTMRAAADVVGRFDGGVHRTVERLIDKSALVPEPGPGGEPSVSVPAVLRLAAARSLARLPCRPALRRAHGDYFRTVASRSSPAVRPDLLAAFGYWREAGDGPAMAVIANALRERCAGTEQARQCLRLTEEVLRTGVADPSLHAQALEAAGELAVRLGSAAARGHLDDARDAYAAAHDEDGVARCLRLLGDEAYAAGDLGRARRLLEEGLTGAGREEGLLERRLAVVLRDSGEPSRAGERARSALAVSLGRGDAGGAVLARYVLATVGWLEQDTAEARALFADAATRLGGLPEAAECLEMLAISLWKWRRITDWPGLTEVLGLADRLRRRLGPPRPKPLDALVTPILAAASEALTAEEYDGHWRAEPSWEAALRLVPGADPPADTDAPADVADLLTKRELEVALLVSEGLTNRVIARRLGIAEWTVVNHLRRVMRKLDCQSRVHVTRRLATR
ncbi:LuxR C-terminal-related transcriptional regulator [Actinomadura sp. DC4]|uniref:LuxR C-terminal-related transcriptional regulator n=1 Tax=Actinomadura sp. DC4 TaxID=3055069 RepID=UPI0025AFD693|nr:LuxR C-terminal-related transcriptional regulator [Actinomadura sp. DC4]MDN3354907.1 LuxR C-terminal-related transcriptional regulator [Actinomadura sp. DC4]